MSRHFVFVRFFLGFTELFPFNRVVRLEDDVLGGAVDALLTPGPSKPVNQKHALEKNKEAKEIAERWKQGGLTRPPQRRHDWLGEEVWPFPSAPVNDSPTPSHDGSPAENGRECMAWGDLAHGITKRYPLEGFETKKLAEAAAGALQERVIELVQAAYLKHRWSDEDWQVATTIPCFFMVAEEELQGSELVRVSEKINRLVDPAGNNQQPEEALLRWYIPMIGQTLDQVRTRSGNDQVKPCWDAERRELRWGKRVCKTYRQPAKNQETILTVFQELDWPSRIDDPLPGVGKDADRRQRLADAVKGLSPKNSPLVFELDGTGEGVLWKQREPS